MQPRREAVSERGNALLAAGCWHGPAGWSHSTKDIGWWYGTLLVGWVRRWLADS